MSSRLFKEFKKAGLFKSSFDEAYIEPEETTRSSNVASTVVPLGQEDSSDAQEYSQDSKHSPGDDKVEEACKKIESAVRSLHECYEQISGGKKLGELFCPNCTSDDLSQADTADGNQSAIDNVPNIDKPKKDAQQ